MEIVKIQVANPAQNSVEYHISVASKVDWRALFDPEMPAIVPPNVKIVRLERIYWWDGTKRRPLSLGHAGRDGDTLYVSEDFPAAACEVVFEALAQPGGMVMMPMSHK